jgi:hypothetical protein
MAIELSQQPDPAPFREFEGLGDIFLARLQTERVHLATLSASLARSEDSPRAIFEELRFRARRLGGTAGIFEAAVIAAAAHALEQAATDAVRSESDHTNPPVWKALLALMSLLRPDEVGQ